MKNLRLGLFPLILFLSVAARTFCQNALPAQSPTQPQPVDSVPLMPESQITIPIQINLKPIYALAEKGLKTEFSTPNWPRDWVMADCATRYKFYFRRTPFRVQANGNTFDLSFTGSYKVEGSTRACISGAVLSPWTPPCRCGFEEGERKVSIGFKVGVGLLPDYRLKTTINRTEPRPLNRCSVCFWNQDITATLMSKLKRQMDISLKTVRDSFSIIDLRPYVLPVWQKLNNAYSFQGLGWLQINPDQLYVSSIHARNDTLNVTLGITAKPVLRLEKPVVAKSSLPKIGNSAQPPGFHIFLNALLQYDSLSTIISQRIKDKRFDFNQGTVKKHAIIKSVKLSLNEQNMVKILVDFDGSYNGTAVFRGKPVYNDTTKSIEIRDIGFSLRTRNSLLRTAKWLLNDQILAELKKYSTFNLSDYYEIIRTELNKQLNKKWTKGLQTNCHINEVKLISIQLLNNHVMIHSSGSGQLNVLVSDLVNWQ